MKWSYKTLLFTYFKNKDAKTNHKLKKNNKMQYFLGLKIPLPSRTENDINSGIARSGARISDPGSFRSWGACEVQDP